MKKLMYGLTVAAMACVLAMFAGCAAPAQSSGAASSDAASSAASSAEAASAGAQGAAQAVDPANLEMGEYQIAVTLEGGSGKATVESPAKLIVRDGVKTAIIVWSSPNYDQMIVDDEQYLPLPRTGNSTFEIPVTAFDEDLPVKAETTAMSEPHMIDYTLHFDSSTITPAS